MIKTPTLYVLVGLPGSGKSTWAEANKQWNVKHISSDAIRRDKEAADEEYTNSDIFKEMYLSTRFWIGEGYSIIYDATNLESKYRKKLLKDIKLHVTWTNKTFEQIYNENDIFKYYGIPFSKITNVKHIGIPHVYVESLEPLKPVAGIDRPVAFVKKEDPKPRADILTSKTFGELFKDRVSNAADNEIYTVELSGRDLKRLPDIFNSKAIDTTHKIIKDGKHVKVTGIYDESRNKILEMVKALGIDGDDLIDILPQINALAERLSDTTEPVKETIKSIDHSGYRRVINRDGLISYEKINRDED